MKRTKLRARMNTSTEEYVVYVDANERLFIKVSGEYISVFHPDLLKNDIRILQTLRERNVRI